MKKIINYRAVPVFLLVLIASIAAGTFLHFAYGVVLLLAILSVFIGVILTGKYRRYALRILAVFIAAAIGLASTWITIGLRGAINEEIGSSFEITGYVAAESGFDGDGKPIDIENIILRGVKYKTESGNTKSLSGFVALTNIDEKTFIGLKVGSEITVSGRIVKIGVNASDSLSIRNYRDNICFTVTADNVIGHSGDNTRFNLFDAVKLGAKSSLSKYCGGGAEFMYAMFFGDKSGLNGEEKGSFSAVGLAHLLAVSGLHVSLLALIAMRLMKKLRIGRALRIAGLTAVLLVFDILCGFAPSVVRATVMILVGVSSSLFGLKNDAISTMSFAACAILVFRPLYLFDMSFIMSFTAVVGLIFFSSSFRKRLAFLPKKPNEILSASLSVNCGMLPVTLHYFGTVSFAFIPANLLILPIISVVYPLALILTCLSFIPYMGYLLVPVGLVFEGISAFSNALASVPFPSLNAEVEWTAIALYFVFMTFMSRFVMVDKRFKRIFASLILTIFALTCIVGNSAVMRRVAVEPAFERLRFGYENEGMEEYGNEGVYVITSEKGDKYLIFNTFVDAYSLDGIKRYMENTRTSRFEALVKESFDENEIKLLKDFHADIGFKYVITANEQSNYRQYFNIDYASYARSLDITIDFFRESEITVGVGGINMLFSCNKDGKLSFPHGNYDIIFAPYGLEEAVSFAPKYIVNNYGYGKSAPYCVSNDFTFHSVNGKIKVRQ